jgi:drug/metabolite transporter (DMT)-like permease
MGVVALARFMNLRRAGPGAEGIVRVRQAEEEQRQGRAILAVVSGAALWGCIWYPYRLLEKEGVHGIWALLLTELVAVLLTVVYFRRRLVEDVLAGRGWRTWASEPVLLAIGLFSGICNVGFVLGTLLGEVMRVTLLLYLAPLWTVLLSRWLLGERLSAVGRWLIALALCGALVMLWHPHFGAPWPASLADWLGLMAGVAFAVYNVLVRKATAHSVAEKSLVSLVGTAMVGALLLPWAGDLPPAVSGVAAFATLLTGFLLFIMIPLVQYGLVRLPANRASVIMLSELLFAGLSAWWLASEAMGAKEWLGGAMIVTAGALSARLQKDDAAAA